MRRPRAVGLHTALASNPSPGPSPRRRAPPSNAAEKPPVDGPAGSPAPARSAPSPGCAPPRSAGRPMRPSSTSRVSSGSRSSSSSLPCSDDSSVVHSERTFCRRSDRGWRSAGCAGTAAAAPPPACAAYFSASRSMASWTRSNAKCSSRTANTACLNALRSTSARNLASSCSVARGWGPVGCCRSPAATQGAANALNDGSKSVCPRAVSRRLRRGAGSRSRRFVEPPGGTRIAPGEAMQSVNLTHHFLIAMPNMVDPQLRALADLHLRAQRAGCAGRGGQSPHRHDAQDAVRADRDPAARRHARRSCPSTSAVRCRWIAASCCIGRPAPGSRPCRSTRHRPDDLPRHPAGGGRRRRPGSDPGLARLCRAGRPGSSSRS